MSSAGSTPNHRYSSPIDNFYDPEFTTEISTKMRVPERIQVVENGFDDPAIILAKKQSNDDEKQMWMHVPERILVAGGEHHVAGREPLPEMKLEQSLMGQDGESLIQLSTPPHTISLGQHTFPTVESSDSSHKANRTNKRIRNVALSGFTGDGPINGNLNEKENVLEADPICYSTNTTVTETNDDLAVFRRQIKALQRRITAIEIEHQRSKQREVVVYTIGVLYIVFKGIVWLHKNW